MEKYFANVTDQSGEAISGALITVFVFGTSTPAPLFSNAAGTAPIANPVVSDANGFYEFYAANGRYSLSTSATNRFTRIVTDILIHDPGNATGAVTTVSGAYPIASSGGAAPIISIPLATGSTDGYLSATDWAAFSAKQPAGSYVVAGGALGAPSSGTLTNATGLPLTTGVTGLLPVANGGTGTATPGLLQGANITITGAWPNQTINAAGGGGGTVTSVGGTAPVVSSGGTTPVISMAAATTSVSGYLTSTDWNTFNAKQPAGTYATGGGTATGTNTGDNAVNSLYSGLVSNATHTGDATGATALTIAANAVTNAKAAQMAVNTIKGRITAGTGTSEDLTAANVRTIINVADGATANTGTVTSVAALTLGTTGTDLSSSVATGTTTPVITLNVPTASAANRGALSAADWSTFNAKQPAGAYLTGNQTITFTGGATGSGTTAVTLTLSNTAVTGQVLTGYVSGAGTVAATDTILQAINKLDGNVAGRQVAGTYVNTVNGNSGTVTAAQISAAATTGYGFTPYSNLNPSGYISTVTWATPGTIGSTTPNTGAFTTLSATGQVQSGSSLAAGSFYSIGGAAGATIQITPNTVSGSNGVDYNSSFVSGGSGPHNFKIGGTTYAVVSNTGLAVTGALSATGTVTGSNLSGTNTGDNAANTTYAADYRAANFVAGTNYIAPTGSIGAATGLTSGQVITALGFTPGNVAGLTSFVISTNTTAVAGGVYVMTASLTLTLPASPSAGNLVQFSNSSTTVTCVIARNGRNIMGLAEDMTIDGLNYSCGLLFADATRGWVIL